MDSLIRNTGIATKGSDEQMWWYGFNKNKQRWLGQKLRKIICHGGQRCHSKLVVSWNRQRSPLESLDDLDATPLVSVFSGDDVLASQQDGWIELMTPVSLAYDFMPRGHWIAGSAHGQSSNHKVECPLAKIEEQKIDLLTPYSSIEAASAAVGWSHGRFCAKALKIHADSAKLTLNSPQIIRFSM